MRINKVVRKIRGVRPTFYVHLGRLPTWRAELEEAGLTDG